MPKGISGGKISTFKNGGGNGLTLNLATARPSDTGVGMFANGQIRKGASLGIGLSKVSNTGTPDLDYVRSELLQYMTHSKKANVLLQKSKDGYELIAQKHIRKGQALVIDYGQIEKKTGIETDVKYNNTKSIQQNQAVPYGVNINVFMPAIKKDGITLQNTTQLPNVSHILKALDTSERKVIMANVSKVSLPKQMKDIVYIEQRPLLKNIPILNSTFISKLYHEQLHYAKTGKESGYERHGMVKEDDPIAQRLVHRTVGVLRGDLARQAEDIIKLKYDKRLNPKANVYNLITKNCQKYVSDVLKQYVKIAKEKDLYQNTKGELRKRFKNNNQ